MAFDGIELDGERAQTSIDFMIGMSIFLIAVGFTFGFIPTIFEPFTGTASANAVTADRTANHLAEDALGDPTEPAVLDRDCTVTFFDAPEDGDEHDCRFTADSDDNLREILTLPETTNVNVTIMDGSDTATVDSVDLTTGDELRGSSNVAVSQRIVSIDGTDYRLYVRIW